MANTLEQQITEEGPRNAVVKLTGVLDSLDIYQRPAIALSAFKNNEPNANLVGLRVDLIEFSVGNAIDVMLEWQSANPQQIFNLSRSGKIHSYGYGGFVPDRSRSGYTGDINLRTANYPAGSVQIFTVVLELVKLYVA